MLNKIFTFIIIGVCSSFLLSKEPLKSANGDKEKVDEVKKIAIEKRKKIKDKNSQNKIKKVKRQREINKKELIDILNKEYRSRKTEIREKYRVRIDRLRKLGNNSKLINGNAKQMKLLKSEGKVELDNLEKDYWRRLKEIKSM